MGPADASQTRRARSAAIFVVLACLAFAGCESDEAPLADGPRPPRTIGNFELRPVAAPALRECRRIAAVAATVRCPRVFPNPRGVNAAYDWLVKPVKAEPGKDAPLVGVEFNYLPSGREARQDEAPIIHYLTAEIAAERRLGKYYGSQLPEHLRPATLAGRRGRYAPPTSSDPCCNHAIFVWTTADRRFISSLHWVGPPTKRLLEAMINAGR